MATPELEETLVFTLIRNKREKIYKYSKICIFVLFIFAVLAILIGAIVAQILGGRLKKQTHAQIKKNSKPCYTTFTNFRFTILFPGLSESIQVLSEVVTLLFLAKQNRVRNSTG